MQVLAQRWEKYLSHQTNGKTHISWGIKQIIRKVLPKQRGIIRARLTTAPELLNKNHKRHKRTKLFPYKLNAPPDKSSRILYRNTKIPAPKKVKFIMSGIHSKITRQKHISKMRKIY